MFSSALELANLLQKVGEGDGTVVGGQGDGTMVGAAGRGSRGAATP